MKQLYFFLIGLVAASCASTNTVEKLRASHVKLRDRVKALQAEVATQKAETEAQKGLKATAERVLDENDRLAKRVEFQGQLIAVLERRADSLEVLVRRMQPVKADLAKAEALMREFMAYTKRRDSLKAVVPPPAAQMPMHFEATYTRGYIESVPSYSSGSRVRNTRPKTQHVSSYTRRTASGKTVRVRSYKRSYRR